MHPNASNLLKIRQGTDCGRFAAAANKIEIGDTIVVEEPQTSVLLPKMNSSHCHHCFTRFLIINLDYHFQNEKQFKLTFFEFFQVVCTHTL